VEYSKVIEHTMDDFDRTSATEVYESIQDASNGTERSAQQQAFRLGASNIGHCQQAALFMIKQTPPTDVRDKSAAFFGTVAGDAIEQRMKLRHPDWLFQSDLVFSIPSGGDLGAHADIIRPADACVDVEEFEAWHAFHRSREEDGVQGPELPQPYVQGVDDLKSKDKLDVIKKYGPSKQQVFQLTIYASAAIDAGLLDPTKPIRLADVYFDRSGAQHEAYTFGWWYDPAVLLEIDDWINDLKYATINNAPASKDKPREWCWSWCEYATLCRGNDTDVEGLIEDPEILSAVDLYAEGLDMERTAKKMKDVAKLSIPDQLSGSTGTHNVRWVEIGPTVIKESTRAGYRKLDIRPVPGPKKPKAKAKPKPKAVLAPAADQVLEGVVL
jgi:hypothetical protein